MTTILLLTLVLFFIQSFLGSVACYFSQADLKKSLGSALGPRDNPPPMPVVGERLARAFANLQEAMPVFVVLALLSLHLGRGEELAIYGWTFLLARVAYVPAYATGVPGLRTLAWGVSLMALVGMGVRLL